MTQYHEPTNEELWAHPPAAAPQSATPPLPLPVALPQPQLRPTAQPPYPSEPAKSDRSRFALAIVSLALGVPLTAIATGTSGVIGLILTWIGIVAVNAIYGWGGRNHS